jgi:hypothetical protein
MCGLYGLGWEGEAEENRKENEVTEGVVLYSVIQRHQKLVSCSLRAMYV